MKKKFAVLLTLMMLMSIVAIPAYAADPAISVIMDGKALTFDVPPIIENGSTLVPLRAIFEAMGATVTWDDATKTASAIKGDTKVILPIGSLEPTKNGVVSKLNVPAKIVNGRTLAPLRFVGEAFGGTVGWDGTTKTVTITTAGTAPSTPTTPSTPAAPANISTAADVVKASIAAFAPVKATMDFTGHIDAMGGIDFSAKGPASIDAAKVSTTTFDADLGMVGKTHPTAAFCPFSEVIAGPEADGLNVVANAVLTDDGTNYVLTATGAPCPASLKGTFDAASNGAMTEVKFNVTVDYVIKVDKASHHVVSVDIVKAAGQGTSAIGTYPTTIQGKITYAY